MEIGSVIFMLMFIIIYYFKFMISSRFLDVNFLFYYKNLLKKKSKLNLLYLKKKCNIEHPHLKPISASFFLCIILFLLALINSILSLSVSEMTSLNITKYIGVSLFILMLIIMIISLVFCEISSKNADKEFERYTQNELNTIKNEIESEWPDFFTE